MEQINLTNKMPSRRAPQKARHHNIPNLEESFWTRSWGARNKTHWYARNLMRNVAYYSDELPTEEEPLNTAEDEAFAKEEAKNNKKKRMNPLAGDFPDDSEAEVRLLGKKEKIVDYIRDSHLPHADPNADPSTLEHANIVGADNLANTEHQTRKGQVIYGKIKYQLRNFHEARIPNRWQTEKHDELMEKLHLEKNAMTVSTQNLQDTTKTLLRDKYNLELAMPRRKTDKQLLGLTPIDKMKIRTEEDKAMAEWVKKYGDVEQASTESLTKLRKCLLELTDMKHIARESQLVRTQKLSEALSCTKSGKLIRLLIRELITLDCPDILERVHNNLQIELSLPLKKDLVEYCRTEMQLFDTELHLARLRKLYLGLTGTWGGLKDHVNLHADVPGKRASSLTALVDGPTRRAMEANFDANAAPAIPVPRIPERKSRMRGEIANLEEQKNFLLDQILAYREKFAQTTIRKYVQKKARALQPDPDAMAEGLAVLSVLTSEQFAREALSAYDRGIEIVDARQSTVGPLLVSQDTLNDFRALNRTRAILRGNEHRLPAAPQGCAIPAPRPNSSHTVLRGHRVFS